MSVLVALKCTRKFGSFTDLEDSLKQNSHTIGIDNGHDVPVDVDQKFCVTWFFNELLDNVSR